VGPAVVATFDELPGGGLISAGLGCHDGQVEAHVPSTVDRVIVGLAWLPNWQPGSTAIGASVGGGSSSE
jgi:hypothetical protein